MADNYLEFSEAIENLRKSSIGEPVWIDYKEVFEYSKHSLEEVVILKLIRAAQGVKSQVILCKEGMFIDMSALFRCVKDCIEEVYFLLEQYPEAPSQHVNERDTS